MSGISKSWDWAAEEDNIWLQPSEESYYIAARWRQAGFTRLLDFGCGLGRHAVLFAKRGFAVTAFDLSPQGVTHLREWAARENLHVDAQVADMLSLPYGDGAFDCLFAYHVISHTDTPGMKRILGEVSRVLRPGGEYYISLCSKETWSYQMAGYPIIDENTVRRTDDGPEKDIPHCFVSLDDLLALLAGAGLTPLRIRHVDDCYYGGEKRLSKHYYVLGCR